MFKNVQKAVVAIVMAVIFLVNYFAGTDINLSENAVSSVVAGLVSIVGPWLVYRVPNKDE